MAKTVFVQILQRGSFDTGCITGKKKNNIAEISRVCVNFVCCSVSRYKYQFGYRYLCFRLTLKYMQSVFIFYGCLLCLCVTCIQSSVEHCMFFPHMPGSSDLLLL